MRLTSYNIALVRLNAGCCLSEMVERMWGYMEEGDTENADCVREKALMLSALIKTLCRWSPTITEGYVSEISIDLTQVTFPDPYVTWKSKIGGIDIISGFVSGNNDSFIQKFTRAVNTFISGSDDVLQAEVNQTQERAYSLHIISEDPIGGISSIQYITSGGSTGNASLSLLIDNVPFDSVQPRCLTNAQVLSIVRKIDELCECNC